MQFDNLVFSAQAGDDGKAKLEFEAVNSRSDSREDSPPYGRSSFGYRGAPLCEDGNFSELAGHVHWRWNASEVRGRLSKIALHGFPPGARAGGWLKLLDPATRSRRSHARLNWEGQGAIQVTRPDLPAFMAGSRFLACIERIGLAGPTGQQAELPI